jgi:hypothetical protein
VWRKGASSIKTSVDDLLDTDKVKSLGRYQQNTSCADAQWHVRIHRQLFSWKDPPNLATTAKPGTRCQ